MTTTATWLAVVALSNPVPPTSHHSGIFYQSPTVTYYADRFLVPRWFALAVTREESSFRTGLETRGSVTLPKLPHKSLAKFLAKYPGFRWDVKNKSIIWVVLSHGMLQTNPRYDSEFSAAVGLKRFDWRNPTQSALVGIGRLAFLIRYYHGDLMLSAASFNAGIAAIRSPQPIPAETLVYLKRIFGP